MDEQLKDDEWMNGLIRRAFDSYEMRQCERTVDTADSIRGCLRGRSVEIQSHGESCHSI